MTRKLLTFLSVLLSLVFSVEAYGQSGTVTGVVLNESGNPMAGATITEQTSKRGVSTGLDGTFEIRVQPGDKLTVSFLGYEDQEITISSISQQLTITMLPKASELDQVVVTAFGKQRKESLVGSIDAVSPKDLQISSSNLTAALIGKVPGLIGFQRSGEPGADNAQFFIRGVTSFGYAQNPLIMLDGFEISTTQLAQLDADNIEQFSVLKDATAAALYGSRGANGVIAITTKRGVEGPAKIFFRHESRFSMPTELPEFVGGVDFMNLYNQARINDDPTAGVYYSPQKIYNTQQRLNQYAFPDVDWYDEMFRQYSYNQYYMLSVSGGGKVVRYYVSGSYSNDSGMLKNNPEKTHDFNNNISIDRFNIVSNLNIQLTKSTTVDLNFNNTYQSYNGPATQASDVFASVIQANPVDFPKYYAPDANHMFTNRTLFGNLPGTQMKINPYANMVSGYRYQHTSNNTVQLTLSQQIVKGLVAHLKTSINSYQIYSATRGYQPYYYTIKDYNEMTNIYTLEQVWRGNDNVSDITPAINSDGNPNTKFYLETGFNYNNSFGKHDVGALLLYTQESWRPFSNNTNITYALPHRSQAIRGRFTYGYDSRYLLEVSMAYQGSEAFHSSNRWGFFPSVAIGYVMSQEKFWEPLRKVVNRFKIRASWGKVGNDAMDPYQRFFFMSSINEAGRSYIFGDNFYTRYYGYIVSRFANKDVTWEMSTKRNIGIDVSFWNTIDLQVDFFDEYRTNIYQARANLPYSMGLTATEFGNIGEVSARGIDGSMTIQHHFSQDFYISARANMTLATNKTEVRDEPSFSDPYLKRVGYPVDQVHGYIAERLFIDQADIDNSPPQYIGAEGTVTLRPGDIKYKDRNGDGRVDFDDQAPIGFPVVPELAYGFGVSMAYKSVDFGFFFQGVGRTSFFINPGATAPFINRRNALQVYADSHWNPNDPTAQALFPRLSTGYNQNNYWGGSTWWMRDGSYLRLKSVELGWSFPERWIKKMGLESIRLYATGQNLFCFSKFDLWDPEMGANGLGYPLQRVYNIGLNVTF